MMLPRSPISECRELVLFRKTLYRADVSNRLLRIE
jgi:hypothetical protein